MDTGRGINIPRQSIIYISLCLTGILIFVIGGIIPMYNSLKEMDKVLEGKRLAIQERSSLAPLYNTLKQEVERKISNALPTPPREKLAQNQIGTIPIAFRTAAQTSGMTMITATPQLSAMSGDAPFIAIDVVVQGKFLDFRKFLINIAALPYIEHIEEIAIQEGTTDRTFKLKVWAAVG